MNINNGTFNNIYLLFSSVTNKSTYNKLFKIIDCINSEDRKLITRYRQLYKSINNNNNDIFPSVKDIEKEFNCSINKNECYNSDYLDS